MKLSVVLMFLTICQLWANTGFSQNNISLDYNKTKLKTVLKDIKSQSGYKFFYNINEIDDSKKISITIKNKNLDDVLKKLSVTTPFSYTINDRQIVLTKAKLRKTELQEREINGDVKDQDGTPLVGVNIIIKGTNTGTTTDNDGNYKITIENENAILVFSYIGYVSEEIAVNGQSVINVTLNEDSLDEIVLTGVRAAQQRALNIKKKSPEFVDAVSAEDVGKLPDQNIAEAIQRVPGVAIQRSRGEGDFVSLRGLGPEFVRGTLNGRSVLSATESFDAQLNGGVASSTGRATNFDILPSEIINTLEVSKSVSANQVEGGIAGTVNVKTSKPLKLGKKAGINVKGTYREFAETFDPNISGYFSTVNDDRTFGFLGSVSYSNRSIREDFSRSFGLFDFAPGGPADYNNDGTADSRTNLFFPLSNNNEIYTEDRDRITALGSFQFKPSETLDMSLDLMYTKRDTDYTDRNLIFLPIPFDGGGLTQNADGSYQVRDRAANDILFDIPSQLRPELTTDISNGTDEVISIGFNANKRIEDWSLSTDISYSKATGNILFDRLRIDANNATGLDFRTIYGREGFNITQNAGSGLDSPSSYVVARYEGRIADNEDTEFAIQLDAEKDINAGLFSSIETGVRYRSRIKDLGLGLANANPSVALADIGESAYETGFNNFFKGEWDSNIDYSSLLFPANGVIRNYINSQSGIDNLPVPEITPGTSFKVDEKTFASYVQLNIDAEAGGIPITGNIGFRLVGTEQIVNGARPSLAIEDLGRTNTTIPDILVQGESQSVSSESLFINFLPSINLSIEASEDFFIRLAASKTLTRPTFGQLNPAFSGLNAVASNDVNQDGFATDFVAGNPALKPYTSTNADIGLEYYFNSTNAFYFSVFFKEIDNYIASSRNELVSQLGSSDIGLIGRQLDNNGTPTDPSDDPGTIESESVIPVDVLTQPDNQGIAQIGGIELGYQHSFENGFGFNANATFVKTTAEFAATGETIDFPGVSDYSFNGSIFYDKDAFEARLAYSYRDDYLLIPSGFGGQFFADSYGQLDASTSYALNDKITIFGSALNLTDARQQIYVKPTGVNANAADQFISESVVGLRFSLGIRASF